MFRVKDFAPQRHYVLSRPCLIFRSPPEEFESMNDNHLCLLRWPSRALSPLAYSSPDPPGPVHETRRQSQTVKTEDTPPRPGGS